MRNLLYSFKFAYIISILVVFLAGCAIGIRPRDYDEIPEDSAYYEESVYDSYYGTSGYASPHHYDPNYDPWTMGTYYQHYSGPPRTDGSSGGSSASSTKADERRPAVKGRDSVSSQQTKAPSGGTTSIKRNRSGSTTTNRARSESTTSSITQRKTKRDTTRGTSQKKQSTDESQVKQRRTQVRSSTQKNSRDSAKDEEDEEKKKTPQD